MKVEDSEGPKRLEDERNQAYQLDTRQQLNLCVNNIDIPL